MTFDLEITQETYLIFTRKNTTRDETLYIVKKTECSHPQSKNEGNNINKTTKIFLHPEYLSIILYILQEKMTCQVKRRKIKNCLTLT